MRLLPFIFQFLYTRNWYTGEMEISRPRLMLFLAGVSLIVLGILIVAFLQSPVEYRAN